MSTHQEQDRQTALVLGGTAPHIELIRELQRRGYRVILIDYLPNPPAKLFADEHIQESTLDADKVLKIAEEREARLVISACIDQANSVCCYVAEKLGLPHPYSYRTSTFVTVKPAMKKVFLESGIQTSPFQAGKNLSEIDWERVKYPAVVKPADCNSSKGVRRVDNPEDAQRAFTAALAYSRRGEAIIEEYVEGTEIQVDCLADGDETRIVLTRQKKRLSGVSGEELNSEGSVIPAQVCMGLEEKIADTAIRIAKGFNLRNTPFFYQAVIDQNHDVNVLEFAPRIGGGLSYFILERIAGFEAIPAVVNSFLGIPNTFHPKQIEGCYSTNLLYMNEGTFDHIEGFREAKEKGLIFESFVMKEKGTVIDGRLQSGNRVGAFIVKADSTEELEQKEREAMELIEVVDWNGKQHMKNKKFR